MTMLVAVATKNQLILYLFPQFTWTMLTIEFGRQQQILVHEQDQRSIKKRLILVLVGMESIYIMVQVGSRAFRILPVCLCS